MSDRAAAREAAARDEAGISGMCVWGGSQPRAGVRVGRGVGPGVRGRGAWGTCPITCGECVCERESGGPPCDFPHTREKKKKTTSGSPIVRERRAPCKRTNLHTSHHVLQDLQVCAVFWDGEEEGKKAARRAQRGAEGAGLCLGTHRMRRAFFFFFCGPARARAHPPPPPIVPPSSFLQVVGAAAVAAIIAIKLQAVTWSNLTSVRTLPCALWAGTGGQACVYGYTVAGVSIAAAAAISLLQCCTCDLCGLGPLLDFVFEVAAAAWWGIASGVFWRYTSDADGAGVPGGEWRQRVNWAAWG